MILEVKNLSFKYHKNAKPTFHDVNLELDAGEVLTILGPNGAGKSTLLNCLANVLTPTSGEIILDGHPIHSISLKQVAQLLGYVPQNHTAAYAYTVREFIVMGRAPHLGMFEKPSARDYAMADEVMEDLGILQFADRPYTEISGGQRQQALIARAIIQQPKIIMFDEPTNHLDFGNQLRMVQKVRELSRKGYAVIMTTHMPDHAILIGGKTAILDYDGKLEVGSTDDILTEDRLRKIYRTDLHLLELKEIKRKICVAGGLGPEDECPICKEHEHHHELRE